MVNERLTRPSITAAEDSAAHIGERSRAGEWQIPARPSPTFAVGIACRQSRRANLYRRMTKELVNAARPTARLILMPSDRSGKPRWYRVSSIMVEGGPEQKRFLARSHRLGGWGIRRWHGWRWFSDPKKIDTDRAVKHSPLAYAPDQHGCGGDNEQSSSRNPHCLPPS